MADLYGLETLVRWLASHKTSRPSASNSVTNDLCTRDARSVGTDRKHHAKGHPARLDLLVFGRINAAITGPMQGAVPRLMGEIAARMVDTTIVRSLLGTASSG